MSWTTVIWSLDAGICLTMAAMHFIVWVRSRTNWVYLLFAIAAIGAAGSSASEVAMMRSQTPEQYGEALRWMQLPAQIMIVSLVWFIKLYLQAGRLWLAWLISGLRGVWLVLSFCLDPNLNFRTITGLKQLSVWGETIVIAAIGEKHPWTSINSVGTLLFLFFVLDACFAAWRQGDRRRAVGVGGPLAFAIALGTVQSILLVRGMLPVPLMLSFLFLIVVVGISYQLSDDLLRTSQLSHELEEAHKRMTLATNAASIGMWEWDIDRDTFYLNETSQSRLGVGESERLTIDRFLEKVHPDEREQTQQAIHRILESEEDFEWEYRVLAPDGKTRSILTRGRVERSRTGKPLLVHGVSMDVSERKEAESERIQLRNELAHVQRVSTIGQLSSALAHELNQPLGAILNNASAAQIISSKLDGENAELGEILEDIISDATRAGQVVRRIRGIVKKEDAKFEQLNLNALIEEVVALYWNAFNIERISSFLDLQPDLPPIRGDRVHLQQVLMNLINNANEAMRESSSKALKIRSAMRPPDMIIVSISDSGTGIDEAKKEKMFEPFFTTKKDGLGMGLRICRSIIEGHGGRIWVENNPAGGATFSFSLKAHRGDSR